jgi:hypothetical protein
MPAPSNDYLVFPFTGDVSGSAPELSVVSVAHVTGGILSTSNGGTGVSGITSGALLIGNDYGPIGTTPVPTTNKSIAVFNGTNWVLQEAVKKYAEDVGDGVNAIFNITHSLETEDITVNLYEQATKTMVLTDVTIVDTDTVTVSFGEAPTVNQYRIVIIG